MIKKILIILLFSPLALFASDPTYFFYVQTPEDVDSYFNIFNAIAKIFGSSDYLGLLKLVFVFGGFFVFAKGVIEVGQGNSSAAITEYGKYTLIATSLLLLIFGSTATVVIKSEKLPTYCSGGTSATAGVAVDNVPELLAYTFSFLDRTGKEMTRLTETAFSVPTSTYGSYTLSDNEGYMGALKNAMTVLGMDTSRLLLDNNGTNISVDLPKMTQTIFSQCILIPFSSKGQDGMDEISKMKSSANLYEYLDNLYTSNPVIGDTNARDFIATYNGENWTCGDLWDTTKPYLEQFKDNAACLYPEVNAGAIMIITGSASPSESDFSNVALQSGLISELQGSTSKLSTGVSAVNYSIGKSKAEFVQTSMATGAYTAEMLPYLQSTLRALLYSMFPFIFVIVLFPGSLPIITEYLKSILWIELWTPTAAVLNMFMIQNAENKMSTIYNTQGFTTVNAIDFLSTGSTIAGAAGYLYASVPALTWLFLTGSEAMLSNFGEGMADSLMKNIRTEEILKDTSEISKRKEVSLKTGEDISLAEMQHYEAVQSGAISGAVLGTQMNLGMNSVKENEAYKVNKDVKTFTALKESTGLSGESLSQVQAVDTAVKAAPSLNATKEQRMTTDGNLSEKAKTEIEQDKRAAIGEIQAKNDLQLTQDQYTRTKKVDHMDKNYVKGQKALDKQKANKAMGVDRTFDQTVTQEAKGRAHVQAVNEETQEVEALKRGTLERDENGNFHQVDSKTAEVVIGDANAGAYNKDAKMEQIYKQQEAGVDAKRKGSADANDYLFSVGTTEAKERALNELINNQKTMEETSFKEILDKGLETLGLDNLSRKLLLNELSELFNSKQKEIKDGEIEEINKNLKGSELFLKYGNMENVNIDIIDKNGNRVVSSRNGLNGNTVHRTVTKGNTTNVKNAEWFAKMSADNLAQYEYIKSILVDMNMAMSIGGKLENLRKNIHKKATDKKLEKKIHEDEKTKNMSKEEKEKFKKDLKRRTDNLRRLGVSEKQLLQMSFEEMEKEEKRLIDLNKSKMEAKLARIKAGREVLKDGLKFGEKLSKDALLTGAKTFGKVAKGGLITAATVFGEKYLEDTNSDIGHMGAQAFSALGHAGDAVFSGAWHFGNTIGFALTGDLDNAKYTAGLMVDDFVEGYNGIAQNAKEIWKTAQQLELHDINDFYKGQKEALKGYYDYFSGEEFQKDYETYSSIAEQTFDETANYYSTHSASEVWSDIKSIFK